MVCKNLRIFTQNRQSPNIPLSRIGQFLIALCVNYLYIYAWHTKIYR